MDAFWIIITGFLVASSTGMLGNLLLLRRMSM
ncbi:MAG: iron ABC transporter, partial [Flavobacteriaceae bacterium]|nr:iron ABC transporter [Flavobacteriaceae bacterium]